MQTKPLRLHIATLGCSKNIFDSERLAAALSDKYVLSHSTELEKADIVILNTCGFIDRAKKESVEAILQYAQARQAGRIQRLYVVGCLVGRDRTTLETELPEVDGFYTQAEFDELIVELQGDLRRYLLGERKRIGYPHHAYLKISEGCTRKCSFCAIPLMRGPHQSRPIEDILHEARRLIDEGVKEISLIAQDLTYYGIDLYGKRRLAALLEALAGLPGLGWLRLHYAYPAGFPTEILPIIRDAPTICKYLDMPLQHSADPILRRMRRGLTRARTEALLNAIRETVPSIVLRSTFIVGFPGETEEDFQELLDFLQKYKIERVGAFLYSHEEGTASYNLPDDVPKRVKKQRYHRLMALQQEISHAWNQKLIGQTLKVLIDEHQGNVAIARTEYDALEVDNLVYVSDPTHTLSVGDFHWVRVVDATEYDLFAEPL
ncbi:MAG: 30S ribosomal protein S12 methylthiotransferase RimO [Bacteroidia bacterium]|jgi:ribosomal protein S12 methylthiotransferase|nr:30S ribosomal protein S12 methylthiotransferase RimO [Bacteroidia bacterium]GIV22706.1 MAG: ribosomal protein S12 methylthiotransferase RimO [Bacteroidia bacterium]